MNKQQIKDNLSIFIMLLRASQDQSTYFKGNVSRQAKMNLNNWITSGDRLLKSLVTVDPKEVDETLEDGSEYYLTGIQLLHEALLTSKSHEAIEALEKLTKK